MEAVPVQRGVAVEVHELRKEFRRKDSRKRGEKRGGKRVRVALDGVSFTMEKGETVAILGQNGSGKSTLVRLLSTLLLPDGGTARIFGHDVVADERAVRRLVNRVSVEASFFKKMSSSENLGYASRFYGMTSRQTRDKIPEILERVGFPADRRGEPMEALSRGMQQKVALARALLTSPVLLLLDEPTTGLDPRSRTQVWELVRRVAAAGTTVLLTTQYLDEADRLADRMAVIDHGRVIAEGTSRELKASVGSNALHLRLVDAARRTEAQRLITRVLGDGVLPGSEPTDVAARLETAAQGAAVISALAQVGIEVAHFSVGDPSLDEVFLALTGKPAEPAQQREATR